MTDKKQSKIEKVKSKNSQKNKSFEKDFQEITPEDLEKFRKLIKKITKEELKKLKKEQLKEFYDIAKEAYPESIKKLSRRERENLYVIQEELFGRLDPKIIASLENIGETLVKNPSARKKGIKYNLPESGAIIIKHWKGKKLEIKIVEGGFEYRNKFYKSLSNLAKEISGYAVSGPIFFGLRKPQEKVA